jgi:hypothetical protein
MMTEKDIIQAISINMLRMAEWYYKDPRLYKKTCQRYLAQSQELRRKVTAPSVQSVLDRLNDINFSSPEPHERTAERCLTVGVLLQHIK